MRSYKHRLNRMYKRLENYYGDLGWWPADTDFEVIVGTVLTQGTAWANAESAIKNLKVHGLMDLIKIENAKMPFLAEVIKPSGFHRVKSGRLKELCIFLREECDGNISRLKRRRLGDLRKSLLRVKGIGEETADSILVYALGKPVFIADAYARRIFYRHGMAKKNAGYGQLQSFIHENFRTGAEEFNRFHAFLVETGKRFCKRNNKLCSACPLKETLNPRPKGKI